MQHVLLAELRSTGANLSLHVTRPGYVPGRGVIEVRVQPSPQGLGPLLLIEPGNVSA
jgi:RNA 3'-terminal phosphate cyclase